VLGLQYNWPIGKKPPHLRQGPCLGTSHWFNWTRLGLDLPRFTIHIPSSAVLACVVLSRAHLHHSFRLPTTTLQVIVRGPSTLSTMVALGYSVLAALALQVATVFAAADVSRILWHKAAGALHEVQIG
jgi:hypothetical protein